MPPDRSDLVQLHTVPNWSPVADCQLIGDLIGENDEDVVSRTVDPLVLTFPSEGRDRLYVGSGHRSEGAIKELRTGLKTNVTVEFELEQYSPGRCKIQNLTVVCNGFGVSQTSIYLLGRRIHEVSLSLQ